MKTKSLLRFFSRGANRGLALGAALLFLTSAGAARGASAAELLEKGIYAEETKGDLNAAREVYRQIVEDAAAERTLVAQAQLRLGLCELKLGNKPQAISALERLTQEFPDPDKLLAAIEQPMPQLLDEMLKQIEQNYIQEVDRSELMETALRAIVGKLDGRGFLRTNDMEFLGTNEVAEMNVQLEQKVAGIGTVLKAESGGVVVATPLAGSPALKGGVLAGDRIVAIDGRELSSNQLATAVKLLRGPVGTSVTLGVKRADVEELLEFKLVRDTIPLPSILSNRRKPDHGWDFMLDEERKIGYVQLSYIGKQSAEEMHAALSELKGRGVRGVILDLRHAPGGMLDGAVAIADLFVESGTIVTIKGRAGATAHEARPEGTFSGFPMAVLVNRQTASAAEIIAACLQDHQRAVVVGERTYGQAIVRALFPLKSGVGTLKLPVSAYYRPSGRNVNRYPHSKDSDDWGVTPDPGYEVALTEEELQQYQKHLAARAQSNPGKPTVEFHDRQLEKAMACVRAQLERN